MLRLLVYTLFLTSAPAAQAACHEQGRHDHLAELLRRTEACPGNVHELIDLLTADDLDLTATMVANRGHHNPTRGSFFEAATGISRATGATLGQSDLHFGHFTAARGATLVLDQTPARGRLMVELIAWDPSHGVYNFYELIGDGQTGRWHYRGDSLDILLDNTYLHRTPPPGEPRFGNRLRCSGCHASGGMVMKELEAPHNDWWRDARHLPLGHLAPDADVAAAMGRLVDASFLSDAVDDSLKRLFTTPQHRAALDTGSLQEKLRPLSSAVEVNFASDIAPLDGRESVVRVPTAFLTTTTDATELLLPKAAYLKALTSMQARFPEAMRADGDHAFLAPVKSAADLHAIQALIDDGTVDAAFVTRVLAVDAINPLFSTTRCGLLTQVPASPQPGWQATLLAQLPPPVDADATLAACAAQAGTPDLATALVRLLAQRRAEIAASQISQNPRGQILEPAFHVIFPRVTPSAQSGKFALTEKSKMQ